MLLKVVLTLVSVFFSLLLLSIKTFAEQVTVFRNIASHYNMSFLEETIDWLRAMSPNISPNSHCVSAASMENP